MSLRSDLKESREIQAAKTLSVSPEEFRAQKALPKVKASFSLMKLILVLGFFGSGYVAVEVLKEANGLPQQLFGIVCVLIGVVQLVGAAIIEQLQKVEIAILKGAAK